MSIDPVVNTLLDEIVSLVSNQPTPMPGAKLKSLLMTLHPEGTPEGDYLRNHKFVQIVKLASDRLELRVTPGTDMLIVPRGRAQLFTQTDQHRKIRIRSDLYKAFAYVQQDNQAPYIFYDLSERTVIYRDHAEPEPGLIPIPPRTRNQEVDLRLSFVESLNRPDIDQACREPLQTQVDPFGWFSERMTQYGVSGQWVMFRNHDIKRRIEAWCAESSIEPDASWFSLIDPSDVRDDRAAKLRSAFARLDDSDFQRIMVPLDVLLKLL